MADRTPDGRPLRILNIIGEYTRECLASVVARRIRSQDVLLLLADLFLKHGCPTHIRSDNGPECIAKQRRSWLTRLEIGPLYIEPGSPWENGYGESFNGTMRDQLLSGELFYTLREAPIIIERWRTHCNTVRPQSRPGASHLLQKPSSLRAENEHGRWNKSSWLVKSNCVFTWSPCLQRPVYISQAALFLGISSSLP